MAASTDPIEPLDPNWTIDNQIRLFSEFVQRAQRDTAFAARCERSPAEAKLLAQKVADDLDLKLIIPEQEVIILIAERRTEYCHVYSVAPKTGAPLGGEFSLKNHLICCYDSYRGSDPTILA